MTKRKPLVVKIKETTYCAAIAILYLYGLGIGFMLAAPYYIHK